MKQSYGGLEGISGYFIGNSQATNDDFYRVAALWQCFVRASKNKAIDNTYQRGSSVIFDLLLLLEANPGNGNFPVVYAQSLSSQIKWGFSATSASNGSTKDLIIAIYFMTCRRS